MIRRPALPVYLWNVIRGVLAKKGGNELTLTQLPVRRIGVVVPVLPQHLPVPPNVIEEVLARVLEDLTGWLFGIFAKVVTETCHSCHARSMAELHRLCSCLGPSSCSTWPDRSASRP